MIQNNLAARYVQLELNIPYDNDDYDVWCSIYYDTQEHKIEKSRFGHGSPDVLWSNSVSLYDAIESGITTERKILNAISSYLAFNDDNTARLPEFADRGTFKIPCNVIGGRKWKGFGYLLKVEQRQWDMVCLIADPVEKEIHEISCRWVQLHKNSLPTEREVFDYIAANNDITYCTHLIAYKISLYGCDWRYYQQVIVQAKIALYKQRFAYAGEFDKYINIDEQKRRERRASYNRQ